MVEFDLFEGGKAFINPANVAYVMQNLVKNYEHLTLIRVGDYTFAVVGNAEDIYKKLMGAHKPIYYFPLEEGKE